MKVYIKFYSFGGKVKIMEMIESFIKRIKCKFRTGGRINFMPCKIRECFIKCIKIVGGEVPKGVSFLL